MISSQSFVGWMRPNDETFSITRIAPPVISSVQSGAFPFRQTANASTESGASRTVNLNGVICEACSISGGSVTRMRQPQGFSGGNAVSTMGREDLKVEYQERAPSRFLEGQREGVEAIRLAPKEVGNDVLF